MHDRIGGDKQALKSSKGLRLGASSNQINYDICIGKISPDGITFHT